MNALMKHVASFGMAAAVVLTSFVPSQALPVRVPAPIAAPAANGDVVDVQYHRRHYRGGYYNGHRGYRERRGGYRYHNGYWFPLAAFGAGAIIGGAVSQPTVRRQAGINPRHYEWCHARYRSYDSYSNTFQPNNGPRRSCQSPYY